MDKKIRSAPRKIPARPSKRKGKGKTPAHRPPSGVPSPLHNWVKARKVRLLTELKCPEHRMIQHQDGRIAFPKHKGVIALDDEDSSLAGSFVDLNKEYTFMLRGFTSLGYTATVINSFFPCDPSASGSNFPEWGDLTPLFSEFKMVEFGVQIVNCRLDTSSTQEFQTMAVGGNLGTAGAPGSYATLVDNADSFLWCWDSNSHPRGVSHTLKGTGLNWSVVTSPTTTPYAGAPGCISIYSTGGASPGNVINAIVWGIYKFRSRV